MQPERSFTASGGCIRKIIIEKRGGTRIEFRDGLCARVCAFWFVRAKLSQLQLHRSRLFDLFNAVYWLPGVWCGECTCPEGQ